MKTYLILVSVCTIAISRSCAETGAADLTYHFFSQSNPTNGMKFSLASMRSLGSSQFSPQKDTLFLIHGWKANNDSDFNTEIKSTILSQNDINVFVVDWGAIANDNYGNAQGAVVRVGNYVADFIRELQSNFGLKLNSVKFVGWSLGAHIAGNTGAALGGQVDRITGLDPAGPFFKADNKQNRLDESDAQFVQVIHTSDSLGFGHPSGHADYFVNGGSKQPGCGLDFLGGCSHSRVFNLYSESLLSNKFVAHQCGSWNDYRSGKCSNNAKSSMGGFQPDYSARGSYYLETNGATPYAKG